MEKQEYIIRNAFEDELLGVGKLLVKVYGEIADFPKQDEKPEYYKMLINVGNFTRYPKTEILVAVQESTNRIAGSVVYFGDMRHYNSPGIATTESNAAGFRLLAVDEASRGKGIGKLLTLECIKKARHQGFKQVIIHTTSSMQTAWTMYEKLGFRRSADLDFTEGNLDVYGLRLLL